MASYSVNEVPDMLWNESANKEDISGNSDKNDGYVGGSESSDDDSSSSSDEQLCHFGSG